MEHHRYFNAEPYWRQGFQRRFAWQSASAGDVALLYCTGSVGRYGSCLSHVLPIEEKRIVAGEGAWLEFDEPVALASPIDYATIQAQVEEGGFSEGMARCGQEGFNFRQVTEGDFQTVTNLFSPRSSTWDAVH